MERQQNSSWWRKEHVQWSVRSDQFGDSELPIGAPRIQGWSVRGAEQGKSDSWGHLWQAGHAHGEELGLHSEGNVWLSVQPPLSVQCILADMHAWRKPGSPTLALYLPCHLFLPWVQELQPAQWLPCLPAGCKPERSTGSGLPTGLPRSGCPLPTWPSTPWQWLSLSLPTSQ